MTKTLKQVQGEQTRQQIIETAARLFARRGFYGTSMSELTTATGLTKGAFYHHFDSKDDLFFAVVNSVREKWASAVAHETLQAENALDRLSILLDRHAQLLLQEPTLCLVMTGLSAEMEETNPTFLAAVQDVYLGFIGFIEEIVRYGQSRQEIRSDADARLVALNVVGLLRGVSCFGVLAALGLNCVAVIGAFKPILLDGLRR